jgi:hypothetical protein
MTRRAPSSPRYRDTARQIYIGRKTWERVKELSLVEGVAPHAFMGKLVREAVKANDTRESLEG